ncbi:MAG: hypothetical protein U0103_14170 [Candidatus Obscuribacterales bacterium]
MELASIVVLGSVATTILAIAYRINLKARYKATQPTVFDIELTEAYTRIVQLLSNQSVGHYEWNVYKRSENKGILVEVTYREPAQLLQAKGALTFTFTKIAANRTSIDVFYKWEEFSDDKLAKKVENQTESWMRAALAKQELPIKTELNTEFLTKLSAEKAYETLLNRISTGSDLLTKWTILERQPPSTLCATVETISAQNKQVTCKAKIEIRLAQNDNITAINCTYRFEPVYGSKKIEEFKQLTDDWLRLLVWTS